MTMFDFEAYAPDQIAAKVGSLGVSKARLPLAALVPLGVLAGADIGLGALFFTLVASDPALSFSVARLLGGLVFCLGLILVIVGGAELFTGNNLLVMAWADRRISSRELARNWSVVYVANFVGAAGLAVTVFAANHGALNDAAVATTYVRIAAAKVALPFGEAFFKGVLCNLLVCLAVWLTLAGRSVTDKILAIVFPVTAFVAAGFEHSVANMYFLPMGLLLNSEAMMTAVPAAAQLDIWSAARNLVAVTLGNIVGGSCLVAAVYFLIYRRALRRD